MQRSRRAVVVAMILGGLAVSGCSFITVRGAPSTDPGVRPVPCTQSRRPPVIDIVGTFISLLTAGSAAVGSASGDPEGKATVPGGAPTILALGTATIFTGSAVYGYIRTSTCRLMNQRSLPSR
jgi:hypothetical protein